MKSSQGRKPKAKKNPDRAAARPGCSIVGVGASGAIRMEISDNGKSFPVKKVLQAKGRKRLGLVGMQERLEMVSGRLVIESTPRQGTTVRAEIPLTPEKSKK